MHPQDVDDLGELLEAELGEELTLPERNAAVAALPEESQHALTQGDNPLAADMALALAHEAVSVVREEVVARHAAEEAERMAAEAELLAALDMQEVELPPDEEVTVWETDTEIPSEETEDEGIEDEDGLEAALLAELGEVETEGGGTDEEEYDLEALLEADIVASAEEPDTSITENIPPAVSHRREGLLHLASFSGGGRDRAIHNLRRNQIDIHNEGLRNIQTEEVLDTQTQRTEVKSEKEELRSLFLSRHGDNLFSFMEDMLAFLQGDLSRAPEEFHDFVGTEAAQELINLYAPYVEILSLAANEADSATMRAFMNQNMAQGANPRAMAELMYYASDPTLAAERGIEPIALSDETRESIVLHYDIVTGSDLRNETLLQRENPETGEMEYIYTEDEPLQVRDGIVETYPLGEGDEMMMRVRVPRDGGSAMIEYPIGTERGEYIGRVSNLFLLMGVCTEMGMRDLFRNGLDAYNGGTVAIDYDDLTRSSAIMESLLGGLSGYDGEIMTESELDQIRHSLQWFRRKGDAVAGDDNYDWTHDFAGLGLLTPTGQINTEAFRETGAYVQENYLTGEPDYTALQEHMQEQGFVEGGNQ